MPTTLDPKTNKMKVEAEEFFKKAFCIDGEAEIIYDNHGFEITGIIKLTDSKRGTFYVARVKKND